jgi:hypothetical protein
MYCSIYIALTIISAAFMMPRRISTGLAPLCMARMPLFTIIWVMRVEVVVPSPALQPAATEVEVRHNKLKTNLKFLKLARNLKLKLYQKYHVSCDCSA